MGLLSVVSRCGGASAPWISQFLAHFHRSLPFGIMGSLSVVSAAMCYVLKETRGLASAETLDDCKEGKLLSFYSKSRKTEKTRKKYKLIKRIMQ